MTEANEGILIFSGIAIASAAVTHLLIKDYLKASLTATLIAVVLFQIAVYIDLGYLDAFFIIAMITTGIGALIISLLIGIPFNIYRKKKVHSENNMT